MKHVPKDLTTTEINNIEELRKYVDDRERGVSHWSDNDYELKKTLKNLFNQARELNEFNETLVQSLLDEMDGIINKQILTQLDQRSIRLDEFLYNVKNFRARIEDEHQTDSAVTAIESQIALNKENITFLKGLQEHFPEDEGLRVALKYFRCAQRQQDSEHSRWCSLYRFYDYIRVNQDYFLDLKDRKRKSKSASKSPYRVFAKEIDQLLKEYCENLGERKITQYAIGVAVNQITTTRPIKAKNLKGKTPSPNTVREWVKLYKKHGTAFPE